MADYSLPAEATQKVDFSPEIGDRVYYDDGLSGIIDWVETEARNGKLIQNGTVFIADDAWRAVFSIKELN